MLKNFEKKLEFYLTHCCFTMPRLTPIESERAIGMLQANMASSVIAQQFRCHVRTIEHLLNRFRRTGKYAVLTSNWETHGNDDVFNAK